MVCNRIAKRLSDDVALTLCLHRFVERVWDPQGVSAHVGVSSKLVWKAQATFHAVETCGEQRGIRQIWVDIGPGDAAFDALTLPASDNAKSGGHARQDGGP